MSATLDKILAHFPDAKPAGAGKWKTRCRAHPDKNPSLSISEGDGGRVLLHCFAGCSLHAICKAHGIEERDLFPSKTENPPAAKLGRIVAEYDYRDADGKMLYQVVRFDPKDFRQRRTDGRGGWTWNLNGTPRVLYRLPELLTADKQACVFVCEGEKDADNVRGLGLTATTNPGGAGKWGKLSDDSVLHGRRVRIIPDKDEAGHKHALDVAGRLHGKAAEVKIVELPGGGKDATDFIEAGEQDGHTPDEIRASFLHLSETAAAWTPATAATSEAVSEDDKTAALAALCTDVGNAARLVQRHGADLRYCAPWGKWVAYDGKRWCPDADLQVMRHAKDTALSVYSEAAAAAKAEDGRAEKLSKWALASQRRERLSAMVDLARCELPVVPTYLDADVWLLNVLNGTIDLRTGELREHRRDDLITKLAPVQFDPAAACPLWDRFLARIMCGDLTMIAHLQRIAGMCLTGDIREQCLFIFYGTGANGKSVFLDTLAAMLGDYAGEAAPDLLVIRRSEEHPCEVADLCGKRLVVASETEEGIRLKVQLIKRLTGNARIKARFMRQDYFEFSRTHKLILATNNRPVVREGSHAIKRRLRLIPFGVTIPESEQDKDLIGKLTAEWPGILAWAVAGCLAWQRDGLTPPAMVTEATQSYLDEQDLLRDFLESCCVLTPDAWVDRTELYAAYQKWAETAGERSPLDRTRFYERVRRSGIEDDTRRLQGRVKRGFRGIGLLANE